jgi:hypothetical protein
VRCDVIRVYAALFTVFASVNRLLSANRYPCFEDTPTEAKRKWGTVESSSAARATGLYMQFCPIQHMLN